ncbi:centromere protein T isoform X2 [Arvicola amphibius]|uniref:centromere protein T isoform X2 n=1 Tax=Arvicola amphibius TaxID=1047088 RepID=UPI0018E2E206|nr:centromere protein T isoform X2 [Arvicola amphibius]
MAGRYSLDSGQTPRTILRRVLDTVDTRSPRRRRSTQTNAQRTPLRTLSSKRQGSRTKATVRRHSYGTRSVGGLAHVQAHGHLEEQTPRTLLKNILLTAPESSMMMPDSVMEPVQVPKMVESSRRESSLGSLELQLPEPVAPSTLAPGLRATSKRKQRLRLSVFQQEVNQGLPLAPEPPGNAGVSSLTSSFNLSFVPPPQPQSVKRPGLARRRPKRQPVDVGALLQDLKNNSLTSALPGDNHRSPVATLPMDEVLEDTQPFSHPSAGGSLSAYRSLPNPSSSGVEGSEGLVHHRTQSAGTGLQHMNRTGLGTTPLPFSEPQPQLPELREAVGSQEAVEAKEQEGSSGVEDSPGRSASPELACSTNDLLQAEQPHQFEPPPPSGVAVLPSRTRTAGPRHHQDPYKAGLSHYMKFFSFYTKRPVEKAAFEIVEKCLDKYFQHLCNDLEVFSAHAGRKTVRLEDLELLLRRQGLVTDQVSLHVLVERYLPLEYRQLLIPCAFSGNSVFPAQ